MELDSFIANKLPGKLRQNIKIQRWNNKCDVKYAFKLKQIDVFEMVGNILLYQKDNKH